MFNQISMEIDPCLRRHRQDRKSGVPLGFFLQPQYFACTNPQIFGFPKSTFLPTSDQGKGVKEGEWGDLDESLSFIGQTVYIKASSNGFLLCSFQLGPQKRKQYCICNPITKEWRVLPELTKTHNYAAVAFTCEGNETSMDQIRYTVVQAGDSSRQPATTLGIETLSSETGEWREATLTCDSQFLLVVANVPALVVDNVVYWRVLSSHVLVYDFTVERSKLELIELPADDEFICQSDYLGSSEGKLHYIRNNRVCLEIWSSEKNYPRIEWVLTATVRFADMFGETSTENNGSASDDPLENNGLGIEAIHPLDCKRVLLTSCYTPFWYNLDRKQIDWISDDSANCQSVMCDYFLYEWPCVRY